jgi:hypothetical protein
LIWWPHVRQVLIKLSFLPSTVMLWLFWSSLHLVIFFFFLFSSSLIPFMDISFSSFLLLFCYIEQINGTRTIREGTKRTIELRGQGFKLNYWWLIKRDRKKKVKLVSSIKIMLPSCNYLLRCGKELNSPSLFVAWVNIAPLLYT